MASPEFDNRRRRYVPLDVMVAFDDFGTKLTERWGMEGLCTWMLFLAACKREVNQGTFTYTSEDEGWSKLGAQALSFTLDDFFKWTGSQRKTSKRRSGRVRYISCSVWEKWNTLPGTQQKPRKQPQNTRRIQTESQEIREDYKRIPRTEVEAEVESEVDSEQSRGLPFEKELELERLLALDGAAANSRGVLHRYVAALPLAVAADVRQRAAQGRRGVGWAVKALQGELEAAERGAA